jgi:hypothetical protein
MEPAKNALDNINTTLNSVSADAVTAAKDTQSKIASAAAALKLNLT